MKKYIDRISGVVPNTTKAIDIDLNGRNLIVTGANGSGKTCFLRELHRQIDAIIAGSGHKILSSYEREYQKSAEALLTLEKGSEQYKMHDYKCRDIKNSIDKFHESLRLEISNSVDFSSRYDARVAVISFFDAHRKSDIEEATTAKGIESERSNIKKQGVTIPLGNNLEQHLVNLRNRRSLAITEENDDELASKISDWFKYFEENLKLLLEDETAKLKFEPGTLKFTISQQNKPEYTFQSLSSGYQAIFDIYADLLMRTEYFEVTPSELVGAVLVDEIDAHLHVSLQRLILPFFTQSFPNVQFIVTTHSPFVLMSAEDSVIFDLSKNEQIDEDISMYSHTSIIEGLLETKTTSQRLDKYTRELAEIVSSDDINYPRLETILNKLRGNYSTLDSKSKSFFMMGESALLDKEQ